MINIGIDFSLNAPCFCIHKDDKLMFIVLIRESLIKAGVKKVLEELRSIPFVKIVIIPNILKGDNLTDQENFKTTDAILICDDIKIILDKYISKDEKCNIAVEGFSFASVGNRSVELGGYQYLLRKVLYNYVSEIHFYSPGTIKKVAGKGNFKKDDMVKAFFSSKDDEYYIKRFYEIQEYLKRNEKWLKPFEDLVDAYWVLKTLETNI